jgi:hypothetical protein
MPGDQINKEGVLRHSISRGLRGIEHGLDEIAYLIAITIKPRLRWRAIIKRPESDSAPPVTDRLLYVAKFHENLVDADGYSSSITLTQRLRACANEIHHTSFCHSAYWRDMTLR